MKSMEGFSITFKLIYNELRFNSSIRTSMLGPTEKNHLEPFMIPFFFCFTNDLVLRSSLENYSHNTSFVEKQVLGGQHLLNQ